MDIESLNNHGLILTNEQKENLEKLADAITILEEAYGEPFLVTSGVRTQQMQNAINPSVKKSAHLTGEAADFSDPMGNLYSFCFERTDLLIKLGLYAEQRAYTNRWLHLQTRPTTNRFFIP